MSVDVEGPINGMLGALAVGVTAKLVTDVTGSVLKSPTKKLGAKRVWTKKSRKLSSKKFGSSWGGNFSNIGY